MIIALAGFFSMFDDTQKIVLERDTGDDSVDYAVVIAIVSIIGAICISFPCAYNPFRL